jgi:hypothetical protein
MRFLFRPQRVLLMQNGEIAYTSESYHEKWQKAMVLILNLRGLSRLFDLSGLLGRPGYSYYQSFLKLLLKILGKVSQSNGNPAWEAKINNVLKDKKHLTGINKEGRVQIALKFRL